MNPFEAMAFAIHQLTMSIADVFVSIAQVAMAELYLLTQPKVFGAVLLVSIIIAITALQYTSRQEQNQEQEK